MYSFAQNGGIKRKITDKQSEIALIGATVSVIGFNSFSTIKDDNGNFQINNVRLSIQTISVSYIVYMPSYLMYF